MQIFIHKNGQQLGPFPEAKVAEMLKDGQAAPTDPAWSEGMETWRPLSTFAQFRSATGVPPPVPEPAPAPPALRKTEPLSIWSLVLGILSIVGCAFGGFLSAIPAVICGHIGLSRIKRDPSLDGKGMAITGLITGYFGLLVFIPAILFAIALPALINAKVKAKEVQMLSNMRQIQAAMQQAEADGGSTANPKLGLPADAKFTSAAEVKNMLVENNYLTPEDLNRLQFDRILIGNVSVSDPPNTILLQAKSENGKSTITFLKDGSGKIVRSGQPPFGQSPLRSPAFLE
jgi:type II secretory pathway pseudopilin PulG